MNCVATLARRRSMRLWSDARAKRSTVPPGFGDRGAGSGGEGNGGERSAEPYRRLFDGVMKGSKPLAGADNARKFLQVLQDYRRKAELLERLKRRVR